MRIVDSREVYQSLSTPPKLFGVLPAIFFSEMVVLAQVLIFAFRTSSVFGWLCVCTFSLCIHPGIVYLSRRNAFALVEVVIYLLNYRDHYRACALSMTRSVPTQPSRIKR